MWMGLVKRGDGRDNYEYMLMHVDESLAVGKNPEEIILHIGK